MANGIRVGLLYARLVIEGLRLARQTRRRRSARAATAADVLAATQEALPGLIRAATGRRTAP